MGDGYERVSDESQGSSHLCLSPPVPLFQSCAYLIPLIPIRESRGLNRHRRMKVTEVIRALYNLSDLVYRAYSP